MYTYFQYRDGQLLGLDLQIPKSSSNRTDPLRPKTLFSISMDEKKNDDVVIKCCIVTSNLRNDLEVQYTQVVIIIINTLFDSDLNIFYYNSRENL